MTLAEMHAAETICLGAIATLRAGKTPSRADASMWRGTFPWASAKDLKSPRLDDTIEHVTTAATQNGSPLSKTGDSLVLVRGMTLLKRVPISRTTTPTSYNQDVCCVSPVEGTDADYLFVALLASAPRLADKVTKAGHGTGRLSRESLESLPIRVPNRRTQLRVAKSYLAFERTIDALSAVIAEKRELKRGLMQELLVTRRHEDGSAWEAIRFGDLGSFDRGASYSAAEDLREASDPSAVRLLRSTNIQRGALDLGDVRYIAAAKARSRHTLRRGDVAICIANGSKALVGKAAPVETEPERTTAVGAFCARFRPVDTDTAEYARLLFTTPRYERWVQLLLAGSNINNLKPSDLAMFKFYKPKDHGELNRICKAFSSLRHEITTLEEMRRQYETLAKGILQRLFTPSPSA